MDNFIFKFKTNLQCKNCVARVTPLLNSLEEVKNWTVDTDSHDKILAVELTTPDYRQVMDGIRRMGFIIEPLT